MSVSPSPAGVRRSAPGSRTITTWLALGLLALTTACTTSPAGSSVDPRRHLTIGFAGPDRGTRELRLVLTAEGLVQTSNGGRYEPRLAEGWETHRHEDGRQTVTIALRRGVTFHDGGPFDSDVVAQFLNDARSDPREVQEHPALGNIDAVRTLGPHSVEIEIAQGAALLLDALAIYVYRTVDGRLSGTGPFMVDREVEGAVTLVANPSYHRGRPSVDSVSLVSYPTLRTAWAAMMRDEVDLLYHVPTTARDFVEGESGVNVHITTRPYALQIGFNADQPALADPRVRRALNHAIDRQAIVEQALSGTGHPASGVWAPHWVFGGVEHVYRYDPALADEMLTAAGFPPAPATAEVTDDVPTRLEIVCLVPTFIGSVERVALLVQRQLSEIGVHMRLEQLDPSPQRFMEQTASRDWDALMWERPTGRALSRLYSIWHSTNEFNNIFGYAAADDALDALRRANDDQELERAMRAVQTRFYEDPPAIFLVDSERLQALSTRFQIPPLPPGGDIIPTLWRWRLADETAPRP